MNRFHWMLVVTGFVTCLHVNAQGRFTISEDGSEVTDSQTSLIWRRCSEGMLWNGKTCTGIAGSFTFDESITHAKSQTGWRVPDVKELAGLIDRSRSNPAIDTAIFPATQSNWYWSSAPFANGASSAWFVFFSNGLVHYGNRKGGYALRLVR